MPDHVEIPLRDRNGSVVGITKVSPEDAHLASFSWHLVKPHGRNPNGYARRRFRDADGRKVQIYLHRAVLGMQPGDGFDTDHINGDRLDNRRENLRVTTRAQNGQNVPSQGGTSRYRGVSRTRNGKWKAQVMVAGRTRHVGVFATEEEAHEAAVAFRAVVFTHSNESRSLVKGSHAGQARYAARLGETRVQPVAPETGPDGRGGGSTLHQSSAPGCGVYGSDGERLAAGSSDNSLCSPALEPSSGARGSEPTQDVSPSGGHRPGS